ncbi:MAG: 3-isopropylmalate dehydratase small subunit [Bacteroidetes bacterium]|nr:3-isopropylmalate dehydratase small subunit [Bacteroidota bacterium]
MTAMAKVVYSIGDDISTDVIYPGRYMATVLPTETPQYAFADDSAFNGQLKSKQIPPGSIISAGANFGCGSSREQAVSTLKGHELIIVARSVARIFMQNAINLGLRLIVAPEWEASVGDEVEVSEDQVTNRTTNRSFAIERLPRARQAIVDAGGLIAYTRKRLVEGSTVTSPSRGR